MFLIDKYQVNTLDKIFFHKDIYEKNIIGFKLYEKKYEL